MTRSVTRRVPRIDLAAVADAFAPSRAIDRAELPEPLSKACRRILARVHALPWERAAFARELAAHARDAHDAGVPIDRVVLELGTPKRVGKLIARAIRRKRPMVLGMTMAAARATMPLIPVALGLYVLTAMWYEGRVPARTTGPKLMSIDRLVLPGEASPQPVTTRFYEILDEARQSLASLRSEPRWAEYALPPSEDTDYFDPREWTAWWPSAYAAEFWPPEALLLLKEADPIVRLLHDAAAHANDTPGAIQAAKYADLVRHELDELLRLDAAFAAERGDGDRVVTDLAAIVSINTTVARGLSPRGDAGANWYNIDAVDLAAALLYSHDGLFTPGQLEQLDQVFSFAVNPDLSSARIAYMYALDRVYGSGPRARLTPAGISEINAGPVPGLEGGNWDSDWTLESFGIRFPDMLVDRAEPLLPLLAYDRAQAENSFLKAEAIAYSMGRRTHLSRADWQQLSEATTEVHSARNPVALKVGSASGPWHIDITLHIRTRLAALRVLIAAHRYRLDHAEYPACVDSLIPGYLAARPIDPVDGAPLRYARTPQGPRIWSVGPDGDDDQGRSLLDGLPPREARGFFMRFNPLWQEAPPPDGDWLPLPTTHPAVERIAELRNQ
jgi:hypothetical protein